jgi:oxygen-independent coproporphyrinogen-3 oxidase
VNRLSIGIQSFLEEDLVWMNRAHHATESVQCLERVVGAGFTDWTADLIYGLPESNDDVWASNVQQLLDFGAPHLSAYCLTVEQGTALHHFVQKGQSRPVDEQQALQQFEYLMDTLAGRGYEHYEISNFALPGRYARHNSRYWLGDSYLGVGPSAHSFDGHSRQWNVSNNARYIKSIENGLVPFEKELITPTMRYNEYVMTRMRTHWGCQLADIQALGAVFAGHFEHEIVLLQKKGLVEKAGSGAWKLTQAGKFQADGVSASLFWVV